MTNVNYLLISGPLKGNISQMTWVVLLCWVDCFQTLLERRSLRWQKQPLTAVDLYLLIEGGLHLCCSAMLSWCPPHVRCRRWAQSAVLRLSRPADRCSAALLPQTSMDVWPGCLQQLPQNCRTPGHLQCRSLYIARVTGEREQRETETVNGTGGF